jgi:hypothetical protein
MALRLVITAKKGLKVTLERLSASSDGIRDAAWGPVDCRATYIKNVKDAPADLVLPGFDPDAFGRDPSSALEAFKHFARSQLGQRSRFSFYYAALPVAAADCGAGQVALAHFDGGAFGGEYLSFHRGVTVYPAAPPGDAEGWCYGTLPDGRSGWYPPSYVGCAA